MGPHDVSISSYLIDETTAASNVRISESGVSNSNPNSNNAGDLSAANAETEESFRF